MERLKQEKAISKKMSDLEMEKKPSVAIISEKADLEKMDEEKGEEGGKKPKKSKDPLVRTKTPFGGLINEVTISPTSSAATFTSKAWPFYK